MSLGVFDPELSASAWFDPALTPEGWFDPELIEDAGTPPPPPAAKNLAALGVG